ncbi:MAG: hypothetical protein COY66_01165 [Candidatus Kerfeldbacteria bacterium CG_4_10_14_0_8_um_filter_42_10]|uniref:Uncharacterized protein n=1 Tax=Candidatus Kerfeldbacteria bacterium CG_4_10_14_0_8_um_filter_42_10 TaxID=2014248 RepID=A0A2M7RK52_9BACT|nr:MAG: hypothetical protein COY66_01165 [Candidatus Kerfeldbacteria bacterium CG_4_10_14_0_8_um_filter_42_10]
MPELPDLEIYKENLKLKVLNKKITCALVIKPRVLKQLSASDFNQKVIGKIVKSIERRGKLLIFGLSSGDKIIVHLMLYGQLQWVETSKRKSADTCLILEFADDSLRFVDGTAWIKVTLDAKEIDRVGPEPLEADFTETQLQNILQKKQLGGVKERLVDQKLIAGIGNAYVDEILWEAGINPARAASLLKDKEIKALYQAIPKILKQAIKEVRQRLKGGISGEPRDFLAVHRKKECPRCKTKIKRIELNKKGTYYCPHCQK